MPLRDNAAISLAETMVREQTMRSSRDGRLGKPQRYLAGDHDLPYMPDGAKAEYRRLAEDSITNWLPLITDSFAKMLFVDGIRAGDLSETLWQWWNANGLGARQNVAHRGALDYGASYGLGLPGTNGTPFLRFYHPSRTFAFYADEEDEWPEVGLITGGRTMDGAALHRLYDAEAEYEIVFPSDDKPKVTATSPHGLGETPLVRYRERFGEDSRGIIAPLIPVQNRINETVFSLVIALQYASFRQRWATGLVVPTDEDEFLPDGETPNPNYGQPIEPFEAAVNRLWVAPDENVKFGDFSQTEVSGHLNSYMSAVRTLAAVAQVSPSLLTGDLSNLSAEALAALEAGTVRKAEEYETSFGESHSQLFRLAALAAGQPLPSGLYEVRWRDREARSLASVVDALGKMVTMLQVPPQEIWDKIPGVTQPEVEAWKAAFAQNGDALRAIADTLARQDAATVQEV